MRGVVRGGVGYVKLDLKAGEHVRLSHDGKMGFLVYVEDGILHVTAKDEDQARPNVTTFVVEADVEMVK